MITVDAADADMRLDAFLAAHDCYPSRSAAVKQIEAGHVFVNGEPAAKKTLIQAGQTIVYEEVEETSRIPLAGLDIPLDIRFEDDYLIVLSKQAGLCVHPAPEHTGPTLVHALIHKYGRENLAHVQGDDRPGIVHRLDMDTSGLMLAAKDDQTGDDLQELIRVHDIDRRYLALVHGNIAHDTGLIDAAIGRHPTQRLRMCVSDRDNAREAQTSFEVLERFDAGPKDEGYTLIACKLSTGRTHQIRVHMEYIGHQIVGDPLYRRLSDAAQLGLTRQFLHSFSLAFEHPRGGEQMQFWDALPADLDAALALLSARSAGKTPRGIELTEKLATVPAQSPELLIW